MLVCRHSTGSTRNLQVKNFFWCSFLKKKFLVTDILQIRINAIFSIWKWFFFFPTGRVYSKKQTWVTANQHIFKSGLIQKLIFIQKLYCHLIIFQFVWADMTGQWRYCMISTNKNWRTAAHASCRLKENFLNNSN